MSKEVATKETFKPPLVTGGRIKAIVPENIEQAYRLANMISAANAAPKSYNRDANAIMIGIMHGMEVGLPPMAALQSIAVINGMPCIWGDGALGLVRASGLLEEFKETIEGEGDAAKAVCWVKRKGEEGMAREFSVADAKKAELWSKKGPWQNYPKRMMKMRARSWALRDGFADVLRGLHIAEEARDMGNLYQAADGAYVPAERPLREHYVKQAEARQQAAEPDLDKQYRETMADHETESAPGDLEGSRPAAAAAVQDRDIGTPAPAAKGTENGGQPSDMLANLRHGLGQQRSDGDMKAFLEQPALAETIAGLSKDEQAIWRQDVENAREALGQTA